MRLLLDTHTFLWWDDDLPKLSPAAFAALRDPANELWTSVVTLRELQIKIASGKLTIRSPLPDLVAEQEAIGMRILTVVPGPVYAHHGFPTPHRDPFDRMLAAQAIAEGMTLVTADAVFAGYPVPTLW